MNRVLPILMIFLLLSCDPPVQEQQVPHEDPYKEQFVKTNRYLQMRHQDQIAAFVERVGWDAHKTASGLWIVIEEKGSGSNIVEGDIISYTFSSTLLDGTACYEATGQNPKQVQVGKGGIESGVEEGLKHLKRGSRAILLIPPHLAHGNFGDRDKIPGNSVLIYRMELMEHQF
jgi:FKBP-type peptidyl-prolyl cis-trans isomerase FkpA